MFTDRNLQIAVVVRRANNLVRVASRIPAVRDGRVFAVDASAYFNRSGPRLVDGLEILAEIIRPELFSGMVPQGGASRIWR